MEQCMKYFFIILIFLFPLVSHADIYKTIDANGNVTYTDKPTNSNSVPVVIPKGNTAPASPGSSANNSVSQESPPADNSTTAVVVMPQNTKKPYVKFAISSPADQESIQNQPNLGVKLDVDPALQEGDTIQVYVDGGPTGNAMHQTTFDLPIPERGTHILSATIFDKEMKVLKRSNSITIFVHQAHIGSPAS